MGCQDFENLIQQLLDGTLAEESIAVDPHLQKCPGCRQLFSAARRLADGLRQSVHQSVPEDFAPRIVKLFLARRRLAVQSRLVVSAALAAGLLFGVFAWWSGRPQLQPTVLQDNRTVANLATPVP